MSKLHTRNLLKIHRVGYEPKRLRRSKPICNNCGDQDYRVDGPKCLGCGRVCGAQQPVKLETEARKPLEWQA